MLSPACLADLICLYMHLDHFVNIRYQFVSTFSYPTTCTLIFTNYDQCLMEYEVPFSVIYDFRFSLMAEDARINILYFLKLRIDPHFVEAFTL